MTVVTGKAALTGAQKLNAKKQEITAMISSMRKDLKIRRVQKEVDPQGLLLKKLNQTERRLPQITLITDARDTIKLLKDCRKPIDKVLGKKGPFEKPPLHEMAL